MAGSFPSAPRKIWLFNPYGPLPGEGWREYSYVTIGSVLAQAGHHVVWWTSNFSHHFKAVRSRGWEDHALPSGLVIRLVPTPAYRHNIGFGRLWRDFLFGLRAYRRALSLDAPDIILTSEPATMAGFAGPRLAGKTGAVLLYDQMDLWPELIVGALPRSLQSLGHLLLSPIYSYRRKIFARLDGAMALARPYLDSVTRSLPEGRSLPELIVYNGIDVPAFRRLMRGALPDDIDLLFDRPGLKAIFAGSLGPSYDVEPMLSAARKLASAGSTISLYIAGDGPGRQKVEAAAAECQNLVYLGKVPTELLPRIYARCDVGLASYSERSNVEMCDKFYDYTAAGLAIVNSLEGEVAQWIESFKLGLQYRAGDTQSLTQALTKLASDPVSLSASRAASWAIAMEFDRNVQHAQLLPWLERVLHDRAQR